jgi:hypothetical protein
MGNTACRFLTTNNTIESFTMQRAMGNLAFVDSGERRSGRDRRTFSYTCYIPERRMGAERRNGQDRRRNKRFSIVPEFEASPASDLPGFVAPRNPAT